MKRWIRRTLIGLLGAGALFGGLAAWASNHYRHGWHAMSEADATAMQARMVERIAGRLDLDAAQKTRLNTLAEALREQHQALRGGSTDPRADLQGLIAGNTFDRSKAQQLLADKLSAVQAKSPAVLTALGDFYDGLRPEQQAKVREFLQRGGRHRG